MPSTGFAVRLSHVRFLTADTTSDDALSTGMDRIQAGFKRVLQAERASNKTELVARAEEVIQAGTLLLSHSSLASEPSLEENLKRTLGLAHFKLGSVGGAHAINYQHGLGYLEQVAEARGSLNNWFNVVTVAACAGDVQRSQAAFATLEELYAKTPPAERQAFFPWAEILLYHACALRDGGFYAEALPHVESLRTAYQHLTVTDPEFLRARGFPPFTSFLKLATGVIDPLPDIDSKDWFRELARNVDREGQHTINSIVD